VEWFHADIGSIQAALEKAPEVFQPISVDLAVHVSNGVVDHLM
jgi:hypothetical protein